jgi:CRP-like cAMP-binding protein
VAQRDGIGTHLVPVPAITVLQDYSVPTDIPLPRSNRLLSLLPVSQRKLIIGQAETVTLEFGDVLCDRDEPFRHVYFPLSGFISEVSVSAGHPPLEMTLIGNEGMLGSMMALGINRVTMRGVVQGPGLALRIKANLFRQNLRDNPALLKTVNRYLYSFITQLTQTATCHRFHEVEARLARWLLLTHDRAQSDHFHLTHQFLADMLGVQRSAVTIAAGTLQQQGLINYSRGEINILDRHNLEASSCECYARAVADNRKLFA